MKNLLFVNFVLCGCLAFVYIGCGNGKYKERMQNTVIFYKYLEVLNDNLSQENSYADGAIQYRAPKQFQFIDKQPDYLSGMQFEGLQGSWTTQIAAPEGKTFPAYMYMVTNRDLFKNDDDVQKAGDFSDSTIANLSTALSFSIPDKESWIPEKIPREVTYAKQNLYEVIRIAAKKQALGIATNMRVYRYDAGDIQTLLIFILPRAVENEQQNVSRDLMKQIVMSLETLTVSSEKPKRTAPGVVGDDAPPATDDF